MQYFERFIAFGDSITEGLCDPYPLGGFRGWADRVAETLSTVQGRIEYFNLAVRGKRLEQVVADQIPLGMPYVTGQDTLVSFHAGANNALRPGYDPSWLFPMYRDTAVRLADTGAQLMLFTVQEVKSPETKTARLWNERFGSFNANVREVAKETRALLLDGNQFDVFFDKRLIAPDRLHLNEEGHRRVAAAVLANLGLPHDSDWQTSLPEAMSQTLGAKIHSNVQWATSFLIPWAARRLTGKSSGDGRVAKHQEPQIWTAL